MVSKELIIRYFISLSALSFFIPAALAQPLLANDSDCPTPTKQKINNKSLRRQLNDDTLVNVKENAIIANIEFEQLNIFNTAIEKENNALFRFANHAHIPTQPNVIHTILLFSKGDKYNPKKLAESERLLRTQKYLYDAQISATKNCDGNVNVRVVTRDLWTLLPEISFSRSGGTNKSSLGFRESNLFGLGKRLSLSRTNDNNRRGYLFVYDDPNILSSRYEGRVEYADNSDGTRHLFELTYPFYAIDTPFSYGLLSDSEQREEALYQHGKEISRFEQTTNINNFFIGHSRLLSNNWTQRVTLGYRDEQHRFDETDATLLPLAKNRNLSYFYLNGYWFEDDFIKVRNFDSIHRTEDLNLGWNIKTQLGYSSESLGNDDPRAVYSFDLNKAHFVGDNRLWRFSANINGYWNEEQKKLENFVATSQVQYYLNTSIDKSWYIKARIQHAKNLTDDKQLTLGGETGLRGYPMHYQHGDRSFLISIEKRYYWEYNLLQLYRVGGAVFMDTGKAWFNTKNGDENNQVLKNIGIGLRLAPSRANAGTIIHLDIAAPLNSHEEVDSVQWLLSVKEAF